MKYILGLLLFVSLSVFAENESATLPEGKFTNATLGLAGTFPPCDCGYLEGGKCACNNVGRYTPTKAGELDAVSRAEERSGAKQ